MTKGQKCAISPTRQEDYAQWYQQVIKVSDLAEHSPVRGCMVIKPWGYQLWDNIKNILDSRFKETGHENAYFPLFIPLSYLQKEAEHVQGFAKECAVVTHHRLKQNKEGRLIPDGELEEPLIVRPTSEMIIGEMFAKWIQSYRDLPLKLNQWANIVRWEMRTRLFLRTTEILWQEGHTAHATQEEALQQTYQMLDIYVDVAKNKLAIPVIPGRKTQKEKFPGAVETLTFEAMMQDGKALQMGTSHFLGQNFSKASNIVFSAEDGSLQNVWMTSWGVTTRLIGAVIMSHGDDNGLVLPPRIAPAHVVIIPFIPKEEFKNQIVSYCQQLKTKMEKIFYHDKKISVQLDLRELTSGDKVWQSIKKGVPLRIEIGPKELENNNLSLFKRLEEPKKRFNLTESQLLDSLVELLEGIQSDMYQKAKERMKAKIKVIDTQKDFYQFFQEKDPGFALAHYSAHSSIEEKIQQDLGVTVRCIPLEGNKEPGKCPFTDQESPQRVIYAKSY